METTLLGLSDLMLSDAATQALRRRPLPAWIEPELATLTHDYFWDASWSYEEKLDGERILACKDTEVTLYSRNRQQLNDTYPEIVDALERVPGTWWLDGEVVALRTGVSNFKELQRRIQIKNPAEARRSGVPVYLYVFDVMYANGCSTTGLSYRDRRAILHKIIHPAGPLRLVRSVEPQQVSLTRACRRGWEGLMVKKLSSTYQPKRTTDWLKFKCMNEQELVIIGYTDPRRSRIAFGALLLGYYQDDVLHYAGKVGTGFDDATLRKLHAALLPLATLAKPVPEKVPAHGVHWTKPELVAQVGFTEWTADNKLRHPRYLGLRPDKAPQEVVKE